MSRYPPPPEENPPEAASASVIDRWTYFEDVDMRLDRVRRPAGRAETPARSRHVLSVHAKAVGVNARFGDDRYRGSSQRGASSLCPAGLTSSTAWDQRLDVLALEIAPDVCERVLEGSSWRAAPFFHVQDPIVAQIMSLLSQDEASNDASFRLYREGLVTSLVAHLGRHPSRRGGSGRRHALAPARLRRVLDYLEEHLAGDVSLGMLASEAGVSERHFCTMFGRTMGQTPHRFLIERRLERAEQMLRLRPKKSLTEIAMQVGFKSSAHFSTSFRKKFGKTPSEHRHEL